MNTALTTTNRFATRQDACPKCGTVRLVQPSRRGRTCKPCADRAKLAAARARRCPNGPKQVRDWECQCERCGEQIIARRYKKPDVILCRSCIGKMGAAALAVVQAVKPKVSCSDTQCHRVACRRGLCRAHYEKRRREANPEHQSRLRRRYYQKNRHKILLKDARRSAQIIGTSRSNQSEWVALTAFYRILRTAQVLACHWCGKSTRIGDRHGDHLVPLSRGGKHSLGNLCCSCVSCNTRRKAMMPEEFSGQYEMVLGG